MAGLVEVMSKMVNGANDSHKKRAIGGHLKQKREKGISRTHVRTLVQAFTGAVILSTTPYDHIDHIDHTTLGYDTSLTLAPATGRGVEFRVHHPPPLV